MPASRGSLAGPRQVPEHGLQAFLPLPGGARDENEIRLRVGFPAGSAIFGRGPGTGAAAVPARWRCPARRTTPRSAGTRRSPSSPPGGHGCPATPLGRRQPPRADRPRARPVMRFIDHRSEVAANRPPVSADVRSARLCLGPRPGGAWGHPGRPGRGRGGARERQLKRQGGATAESVSAECRALGVPSVDVKAFGRVLKGCRRAEVEPLAGAR